MSSNCTQIQGTQGFVSDTVLNLQERRMFKLVFLLDMFAEANSSTGPFIMLGFALWSDRKAASWAALELRWTRRCDLGVNITCSSDQ